MERREIVAGAAVRVGIVGAGAVADRHARVLSGFDDVWLVAVADPDDGRGRALAAAHDIPWYGDHELMLDAERLDAVYVCVPPFAHGRVERDVLAAGLGMFVEKPLAADLATAEKVALLVERAGVPVATGYHWRCLDTVQTARALLEGRQPRLVQASWLDKVPPPAWWRRRELSGGQTVEQTTHVLDLLCVLVGDVVEVSALSSRCERSAFEDADVDDVTAATLRFSNGALGTVVSSCLPAAKHRAGIEIVCDRLVIELDERMLAVSDDSGRAVTTAGVDAHVAVDRDFIDALRGDTDRIRVPYAEALRTHRLACALARSAIEGRAVAL